MLSNVIYAVFHNGDAWDSMFLSIRSSSFRMNKVLSYINCMGLTGNFSLTLSIFLMALLWLLINSLAWESVKLTKSTASLSMNIDRQMI